jgi:pimeloyl-ACP methyl ester carboxylesterase
MNTSAPEKTRPPRSTLRRLLLLAGLTYLACCAFIGLRQRQFIYFPPKFDSATVDREARLAGLTRWNSPTGQPLGWKRSSPSQPCAGQVLVIHGNGGCAFELSHYADDVQRTAALDVYLLEYPGYADRPGKVSESSFDAAAAEALQNLPTNRPTYLLGESLGTGVSTWLAGKHPDRIAGIVLLGAYNSLASVGQAHMPLVPVHLLLIDRFRSENYLRTYSGPVAIVVGGRDPVVPARFGRRLYQGYRGPKRLWDFPLEDHGSIMNQSPEVWSEIFEFLRKP